MKQTKSKQLVRTVLIAALCMIITKYSGAQVKGQWTALFNGKTLAGWKKLAGKASFSVEDGSVVGTSVMNTGSTYLATEKEYADFILEMDVKTESPLTNSGVQTRSHYTDLQNDGNRKVVGRQVEVDPSRQQFSGGIYDQGRRKWLYLPELNPNAKTAYRTGEYNHFKIECIGNEMKTWVNGIPVAYLVDTIDRKGFIALQVHAIKTEEQAGKKVFFKNIKITTTGLKAEPFPKGIYVVNNMPNTLSAYEKMDGWKLLFDGKSSNGWRSAYKTTFPQKGWEIKNGTMTVLSAGGKEARNGGDIVTSEEFHAFDVSFNFLLTTGANSGMKYFVTEQEKTENSAIGLEYQVLDDSLHPDAKLGRDGNRTLSSLYDLIKAEKPGAFIHKIGEWNTGRIVVYPNNHVEHYLNGKKVLEYDRGSKPFKDLVAISKYVVWKNFGEAEKGHLLLQDHGNEVSYKSIKIKLLK